MTAYYIDNTGIYTSDGKVITKPDVGNGGEVLLTTLLNDHPKDNKLFYDLDACVANLLHLTIGEGAMRELADKEKVYVSGGIKITYFPNRFFALDGRNSFVNFGNMTRYKSDTHYSPIDTIEDKIDKAKEASDMAKSASEVLGELGLDKQRIISPVGALIDKFIYSLKPPTVDDYPEEVGKLAYDTIQGNWLEAFKLGSWQKAYDYDVNCYSGDTEALTIDGWKLIKELQINEQILGFNTKTNKCSFQPIRAMTTSPYRGVMINIKSSKVDLLVTPNHRVLFKNHIRCKNSKTYKLLGHDSYTDWQTKDAITIPNGNIRLPISFPIIDKPDYEISDDILRLIAWVNTEGNAIYSKDGKVRTVRITQTEADFSNKQYCNEIEEILSNLNLRFNHIAERRIYKHETPLVKGSIYIEHHKLQITHRYRIMTSSFNNGLHLLLDETNIHNIPLWVLKNCSLRQLRIYYDTLLKGDGSRTYNNEFKLIKSVFVTQLLVNKDRMQYLCHLLGYKVSYSNPDKHHKTYQLYIIEDRGTKQPHEKKGINYEQDLNYGDNCITKVLFDGIVTCPTVDDGYIIIRRNGKSCICGNSAYGSVLARLVDTRRGTWVHSNEMPPRAFYGFASGILTVDAPFHPFIMKQDEEYTYTPVGSRRDTLPKSMIDLLYKYKLGTFEIDNGWWWIPSDSKPMYEPLRGIITHLHTIRSESDGLKKAILRQMIAGIWGRMLEIKKDKFGTLFNPVWASVVENEIKCQVCETCLSNNITPLLVAVDGIITDKPLPIESSLEMGKWRLSHVGKCIIVSSGVVGFEGKQGAEEFALRYEWLQNQLFDNPSESEFSMNKYSPLTLAKAIQTDNLKHLGELQEVNRVINIGKDYKRLWKKYPKCGEDLLNNVYDSVPIDSIMAGGTVEVRMRIP